MPTISGGQAQLRDKNTSFSIAGLLDVDNEILFACSSITTLTFLKHTRTSQKNLFTILLHFSSLMLLQVVFSISIPCLSRYYPLNNNISWQLLYRRAKFWLLFILYLLLRPSALTVFMLSFINSISIYGSLHP